MSEALLSDRAATPRPIFLEHRGVVDYLLGQVHLYINALSEEAWFDLHPGWRADDLGAVVGAARRCGYAVMDEEDSIEDLGGGRVRQWLVEAPYIEELVAVS